MVRKAARNGSFAAAAESLNQEAEITMSGRQVGRIAHEVGGQLQQRRDQRVEAFREKSATPEVTVAPRLAAVFVNGGRLRTRDEEAGRGSGVFDPASRKDKVANLLTMHTEVHPQDPHPELPRCFTKKREVVELVQGVSGQGALADVTDPGEEAEPALTVFEPAADDEEPRWPPSRWCGPARPRWNPARCSARWWQQRRSGGTYHGAGPRIPRRRRGMDLDAAADYFRS